MQRWCVQGSVVAAFFVAAVVNRAGTVRLMGIAMAAVLVLCPVQGRLTRARGDAAAGPVGAA